MPVQDKPKLLKCLPVPSNPETYALSVNFEYVHAQSSDYIQSMCIIENMQRLWRVMNRYREICSLPDECDRVAQLQEICAITVPERVLAALSKCPWDKAVLTTKETNNDFTIQSIFTYYLRCRWIEISACLLQFARQYFDVWWDPTVLNEQIMYHLPLYVPDKRHVWEPYYAALALQYENWEEFSKSMRSLDVVNYRAHYLYIKATNPERITSFLSSKSTWANESI